MFDNLHLLAVILMLVFLYIKYLKATFLMSYYKQKLLNRGVDVSDVENMSLIEMFRS